MRITSASTLLGGKRHKKVEEASFSIPTMDGLLDLLKASEVTNKRISSFIDHGVPSGLDGLENSDANQSNNSGWLGLAPATKITSGCHNPCTKMCCQIRFAMTLADKGFS